MTLAMTTKYVRRPDGSDGWRWSLIRLIPTGADVVAHGCRTHLDEDSCRRDIDELYSLEPQRTVKHHHQDGSWTWSLMSPDGEVIAESRPAASAAASAAELHQLQYELSIGIDVVIGSADLTRHWRHHLPGRPATRVVRPQSPGVGRRAA
jgi:hypothetical protein